MRTASTPWESVDHALLYTPDDIPSLSDVHLRRGQLRRVGHRRWPPSRSRLLTGECRRRCSSAVELDVSGALGAASDVASGRALQSPESARAPEVPGAAVLVEPACPSPSSFRCIRGSARSLSGQGSRWRQDSSAAGPVPPRVFSIVEPMWAGRKSDDLPTWAAEVRRAPNYDDRDTRTDR